MSKSDAIGTAARRALRGGLLSCVAGFLAPVALAAAIDNSRADIKNVAGQGNATPGGPAETTTVKSSKSNSSDRVTHDDAGEETERSINLNSSRAGLRAGQAAGGATDPAPAPQNGAIVKSKSNITNN